MIKIKINESKVKKRLDRCIDFAQSALDQQVIKDSNFYAPFDVGGLRDSAIIGNKPGKVIYNAPYAKAQYYGLPNKSKDRNPNASMKWFERAKAKNKKAWVVLANKKTKECS